MSRAAPWGLLVLLAARPALAQHAPIPADLTPLDSEAGRRLLDEATDKVDFFALASRLESQRTQAFCGVASAVTVLNALPIRAPAAPAWAPYHAFTQDNLWNACTRRVMGPDEVNRGGLTLDQLGALLQCHPVRARVVHAADTSADAFRRDVRRALAEPGSLVVANFSRGELGQEAGGHFSPLAAYHRGSDRFLLLDVARYKFPPLWVPAAKLFAALHTDDPVAGKTRGYVIVSPAPRAPGPGIAKGSNFLLKALAAIVTVSLAVGFALGLLFARWRARQRARRAPEAAR